MAGTHSVSALLLVRTFLAAVDELAGVDALGGDERLQLLLVAVRVAEHDLRQGSPAPGVVDDVLQNKTTR